MKNIAILASGEGTNAERIIQYFQERGTACPVLVIATRLSAGVVKRAETLGIPVEIIASADFSSGRACEVLHRYQVDFVVLAGFLLRVPDDILHDYSGNIVNIHPSLLPKFGGKGMYGQHVHEAVLAAGEQESGITIHYINEHYDEGAVIFQAKCPVFVDDTPEALAYRVHQLEYLYYPSIIERLLV